MNKNHTITGKKCSNTPEKIGKSGILQYFKTKLDLLLKHVGCTIHNPQIK